MMKLTVHNEYKKRKLSILVDITTLYYTELNHMPQCPHIYICFYLIYNIINSY